PAGGPLSRIGEENGWLAPELAPVPETLTVGLGPGEVEAYNHFEADAIVTHGGRPADDLLPLIEGGSSFEPRWIDDRTVEVFTRPEFVRSASYWVLLRLADADDAPERLIVRTVHWGGANMTPTFFASADGDRWRRVVPERIMMVGQGAEYAAQFRWADIAGGYLASSPVFGDREREALVAWAEQIPGVGVREIGETVEGRPLHAIELGDGPRGVAFIFGQHSPLEIMDALMIEPMIRALLERRDLLAEATFVFVPTVNVDCAHYGGSGLNVNRRNLNRHWLVEIQPETRAVIDRIEALREEGLEFEFGIDFHAGGIFRNPVLMHMAEGEVPLSDEAAEAQEPWRDALERHAGLRRVDGWGLGQMRFRATDWLQQELGAVAFCLELSTCSYYDPREGRTRPFEAEALDIIVEGIVKALEERMVGA
ncbi:MAG: M14 family zinc carboxypeptidase, partial [Armatimonadota bacterium]